MKYLLFLIVALFFVTVNAQDDTALKAVQDKFNSADDISANVKQVVNGKTHFSGKVFFKKENKFRIEFDNNTLISDGTTTWNYSKKDKKVVIDLFDSSNPSALSFSTILNDYPSKSEIKTSTENGKKVISLTPKKNSGLNFKSAKLWISNDNLVEKIAVTQSGSATMSIEISNYKLNQKIPNSQFSFNPPEGTTVIDLR